MDSDKHAEENTHTPDRAKVSWLQRILDLFDSDVVPRDEPKAVSEARDRLKRASAYKSDDYDLAESDLHRELLLNTTSRQFAMEEAWSWVLSFFVGIAVGITGFLFNWGIWGMNELKYNTTNQYVYHGADFARPYLVFISFAALYGAVAGFCGSFLSKQAAGSGIPEIKVYLNGIHVRGLLTIRTLIAKAFGVSFSIASGLFVGKEGPFIHVGAILGGGVAGMGSQSLTRWTNGRVRAKLRSKFGGYFRNPVDHRDYVAAGTAAGVSTAFGAPISGVLFAVEQGASFFNLRMLWHTVVAAAVALFFTVLLTEVRYLGLYTDGNLSHNLLGTKLMSPETFTLLSDVTSNSRFYYYAWELPIFCAMGCVGGALGALLVQINNAKMFFTSRYFKPSQPFRRTMEVVFYAVLTSTIWFLVTFFSPCGDVPETVGVNQQTLDAVYPRIFCPDGQYSLYGVLFWQPIGDVLSLIIQYQLPSGENLLFDPRALALMFFLGYFMMSLMTGIGAPTGMFIPSVVVGGAAGRLVGRGIRAMLLSSGLTVYGAQVNISLQTYAAVGAAAMLGGTTRMLLSTCVIVIETTGSNEIKVPLIMAAFFAKVIGDAFCMSIYDIAIYRQAFPFMEAIPKALASLKLQAALSVEDVMSDKLVSLPVIVRVRELVAILRKYTYSTFPIVERNTVVPHTTGTGPQGTGQVSALSSFTGPGNNSDLIKRHYVSRRSTEVEPHFPWVQNNSRCETGDRFFQEILKPPMSHKSSDGGGLISQRTSDQGGTVADVSMRGVSRRLDRASANALRGEHQEDSTNGNQAPIKLNDGESATTSWLHRPQLTHPVHRKGGQGSSTYPNVLQGGREASLALDDGPSRQGSLEPSELENGGRQASIAFNSISGMQTQESVTLGEGFTSLANGGLTGTPTRAYPNLICGTHPHTYSNALSETPQRTHSGGEGAAGSAGAGAAYPGADAAGELSQTPQLTHSGGEDAAGAGGVGGMTQRTHAGGGEGPSHKGRVPRQGSGDMPIGEGTEITVAEDPSQRGPHAWYPGGAAAGSGGAAGAGASSSAGAAGAGSAYTGGTGDASASGYAGAGNAYSGGAVGAVAGASGSAGAGSAYPAAGGQRISGGTCMEHQAALDTSIMEGTEGSGEKPLIHPTPSDVGADTEEAAGEGATTLEGAASFSFDAFGDYSVVPGGAGKPPLPPTGRKLCSINIPLPTAGISGIIKEHDGTSTPSHDGEEVTSPFEQQLHNKIHPTKHHVGHNKHLVERNVQSVLSEELKSDLLVKVDQVPEGTLHTNGQSVQIAGIVARSTVLKMLESRMGFCRSRRDAQDVEEIKPTGIERLKDMVIRLDRYPLKAPSSQEGQEALFSNLTASELDSYVNLEHLAQRVPVTLPVHASVSRAYQLFRTMGLHHILVTEPTMPVVGVLTRKDLMVEKSEVVFYDKMVAGAAAATAAAAASDTGALDYGSQVGGQRQVLENRCILLKHPSIQPHDASPVLHSRNPSTTSGCSNMSGPGPLPQPGGTLLLSPHPSSQRYTGPPKISPVILTTDQSHQVRRSVPLPTPCQLLRGSTVAHRRSAVQADRQLNRHQSEVRALKTTNSFQDSLPTNSFTRVSEPLIQGGSPDSSGRAVQGALTTGQMNSPNQMYEADDQDIFAAAGIAAPEPLLASVSELTTSMLAPRDLMGGVASGGVGVEDMLQRSFQPEPRGNESMEYSYIDSPPMGTRQTGDSTSNSLLPTPRRSMGGAAAVGVALEGRKHTNNGPLNTPRRSMGGGTDVGVTLEGRSSKEACSSMLMPLPAALKDFPMLPRPPHTETDLLSVQVSSGGVSQGTVNLSTPGGESPTMVNPENRASTITDAPAASPARLEMPTQAMAPASQGLQRIPEVASEVSLVSLAEGASQGLQKIPEVASEVSLVSLDQGELSSSGTHASDKSQPLPQIPEVSGATSEANISEIRERS